MKYIVYLWVFFSLLAGSCIIFIVGVKMSSHFLAGLGIAIGVIRYEVIRKWTARF